MPSLKEIRGRINSVTSTRKITSAMRVISTAKLRKAQAMLTGVYNYAHKLFSMLDYLLADENVNVQSHPLAEVRDEKRVALVCISSDTGLCGAFNSNIINELERHLERYDGKSVVIYPIGKKVRDYVLRKGYNVATIDGFDYSLLSGTPKYDKTVQFVEHLKEGFLRGEFQRIEVIYHHLKNAATQTIETENLLPFQTNVMAAHSGDLELPLKGVLTRDYIIEPSVASVINRLVPLLILNKMWCIFADSFASEHSARSMAMKIATDNADELLSELRLQYNKCRQSAITNELLDIMGASMNK